MDARMRSRSGAPLPFRAASLPRDTKNKCIAQPCRFPRRQGEALHYRMAILMGEERRCAPNFWRKPLLLRRRTCGVREVLPGYASLHLCQDGVEQHSGNGGATFFAAHNNARQVAFPQALFELDGAGKGMAEEFIKLGGRTWITNIAQDRILRGKTGSA